MMANTSIYVNDELLKRAKYFGINISQICRDAILEAVIRAEAVETARWERPEDFRRWEDELLQKYIKMAGESK